MNSLRKIKFGYSARLWKNLTNNSQIGTLHEDDIVIVNSHSAQYTKVFCKLGVGHVLSTSITDSEF